jgi:hypothetical protein
MIMKKKEAAEEEHVVRRSASRQVSTSLCERLRPAYFAQRGAGRPPEVASRPRWSTLEENALAFLDVARRRVTRGRSASTRTGEGDNEEGPE